MTASSIPTSSPVENINTDNLSDYRVLVILPAYNEGRSIGDVLSGLQGYPLEVLVVDDGSTDNTSQVAEAAGAEVYRLEKNQGKGAALNCGFAKARNMKHEAVVVMDADGQHLTEELPQVLAPILSGEADICVGSRYLCGKSETPTIRRIGHCLINLVTNVMSGINLSDTQSGYRAFSGQAVAMIQFISSDFSVESEMQFLIDKHKLQVAEVPITVRYSEKAKRPVVQHGLIVITGILRLVSHYKPSITLRLLGLIFLTAGFLWGFILVWDSLRSPDLTLSSTVVTVFLSAIGVMMLSTGLSRAFSNSKVLTFLKTYVNKNDHE